MIIKEILKNILRKLSFIPFLIFRVLKYIYPEELKPDRKKTLLELKLEENLVDETFNNFKDNFKKSLLFTTDEEIRSYAIKTALLNDQKNEYYNLEFGVWKGNSFIEAYKQIEEFSNTFDNVVGFRE